LTLGAKIGHPKLVIMSVDANPRELIIGGMFWMLGFGLVTHLLFLTIRLD